MDQIKERYQKCREKALKKIKRIHIAIECLHLQYREERSEEDGDPDYAVLRELEEELLQLFKIQILECKRIIRKRGERQFHEREDSDNSHSD